MSEEEKRRRFEGWLFERTGVRYGSLDVENKQTEADQYGGLLWEAWCDGFDSGRMDPPWPG
jgi:hypothetical protein